MKTNYIIFFIISLTVFNSVKAEQKINADVAAQYNVISFSTGVQQPVIWADHHASNNALDWSGSGYSVTGDVHSNSGIKMGGSNNVINGSTTWVTQFDDSGNNSFNPAPLQSAHKPWPYAFVFSDYQPGGAVALAAGSQFYDITGTCDQNGKWQQDVQGNQLATGLYWVPCDVLLNASNLNAEISIVSTGKIELSGSVQNTLQAHTNNILFWTSFSIGDVVKLSGSNSTLSGVVLAPNGSVEVSGSELILNCGLAANRIKLNGSNNQIKSEDCVLVNAAPTAVEMNLSTNEDTTLALTLSGTDPEDDVLSYQVATQPTQGALSGTAPNLTYTPNANFNGSDGFIFLVNDGDLDSDVATVSIAVNAVNDAPIADAQSYVVDEDATVVMLLSGSDADEDVLTYVVDTQPTNGILSGLAPNLTYTPNANYSGSDVFTYHVSDGSLNSITATITLTVSPINDAPTANDLSINTDEDTAVIVTLAGTDSESDA